MGAITGAVIGLAGAGMSAYQAVQQNKLAKAAKKSQEEAASRLRNQKEVNVLKSLQAPTSGTNMAMDLINQQAADYAESLKGVGASGAIAGAATLNKSVRDASLDVAARLDESIYNRDLAVAQEQSRINRDEISRNYELDFMSIYGAQQAQRDAEANRNAAIMNSVSSLSSGISSLGDTDKYDYNEGGGLKMAGSSKDGLSAAPSVVANPTEFESNLKKQGYSQDQIDQIMKNLGIIKTGIPRN